MTTVGNLTRDGIAFSVLLAPDDQQLASEVSPLPPYNATEKYQDNHSPSLVSTTSM